MTQRYTMSRFSKAYRYLVLLSTQKKPLTCVWWATKC
nr:MAG TPA: hypothetical protein [Caudoviricetes sp.]